MKKRLLFAAFALLTVSTSFAYEVSGYVFNQTQRFKIDGENLVVNGDFINSRDGWYGADKESGANAETWGLAEGVGPNGENALKSEAPNEGQPLCNSWTLSAGTYIVAYDIKLPAASYVNILTAGAADVPTPTVDFFINTDGNFTKVASTDEAPVINVASSVYVPGETWKTVVFGFTAEDGQTLVMHAEKLPAEAMITNISVQQAHEVYDIRIAQRRIEWLRTLMSLPEFNTAAAAEAKQNLEGIIEMVEGYMTTGEMDDISGAAELMTGLETEGVAPFMAITARRMNDKLTGTEVETLTGTGKINRGDNNGLTKYFPNLELTGGNWQHAANADYVFSAIQGSYANSGTYNVFNTNFPKGRYLFAANIRNANVGSSSNYVHTYTLETMCKIFVGKDSTEVGPVVGEDYQHFYQIGDIDEDGTFRAGVEWPGKNGGSSFFVKDVEVYLLGDAQNIEDQIAHIEAWKKFKEQWDAVVGARANMWKVYKNANYPWEQDSLTRAFANWDEYYEEVIKKGWIAEDGSDAGVATTDELNEWAKYHGVEIYNTPEATDENPNPEPVRQEYQLVRNYNWATAYVTAANQPFTDLGNAIEAAKSTRNNGANLTGNREAYKTAILAALNTLKTVRATTSDATREADTETLNTALTNLNAATETFLSGVSIVPFIDIDFTDATFKAITEDEYSEGYAIEGAKGRMLFSAIADDNNDGTNFALGVGEELMDVLRVGNGSATVYLSEEQQPTESEALRIQFDMWHGSLSGRNAGIELRNASNERVAGFSINRYNGSVAYNEFNDVLTNGGTGMNLLKYVTGIGSSSASNAAIKNDATNKTSYDLVVDYLNKTLTGTIVNVKNGTCEGAPMPFRADITDQKIVKFVLFSNYNNKDRRCWFDNLKISKYAMSDVVEDITEDTWAPTTGIKTIENVENTPVKGIFNLQGQRVEKAVKGLYIINGKKVMMK